MSYPNERHALPARTVAAVAAHASSEAEAVRTAGQKVGAALAQSIKSIGSDLAGQLADHLGDAGADFIDADWTHVEAEDRPGRYFAHGLSEAFELMTNGRAA